MNENDKEQSQFSLEDILQEFGETETKPETELEQDADMQVWGKETENSSVYTDLSGDTIRLNEITEAVQTHPADSSATVRFTPVQEAANTAQAMQFTSVQDVPSTAQTVRFAPVQETAQTVRFTPVGTEKPDIPASREPVFTNAAENIFSDNWEPQYEGSIGEYVPENPIVRKPRSRIMELKHQLVEGPERRYYELVERGVGRLQGAIFISILVTLLSAGAAIMHTLGMVDESRMRLLVFGEFILLLFSALLGSYQMIAGIGDLLRKRFTLNTLLIFSFAACCADAIICLNEVRVSCCAAFSLTMTMSLWASLQRRNTEIAQMDTLRKAPMVDCVVRLPDFYEDKAGFLRGEGQPDDFMNNYDELSGPGKVLSTYSLVVLFLSLGIGIAGGVLHNGQTGLRLFATSLLVAVPASAYITLSRPTGILERRLHRLGTVICGWQGVTGLCKPGIFPISDQDLFPEGSAKLNGVKFFGSRKPDDVIAYAAALISTEGGGMVPLFDQLLDSRNGIHYDVSDFHNYGNGGIGGVVNNEAVLVGSLTFMQSMGVDMHAGTRVSQALYAAIDGQLCGVFAVSYAKVKSASTGLATLCSYRKLIPMLTSTDFMLTESLLRSRFGLSTRKIVFPTRSVRSQLAATKIPEDQVALALTTRVGLASSAFAVTGARALRSACRAGVTIHMIGGIMALLMMGVLAVLGEVTLLNPANILLYQLIWMIPGLLITEWTRIV